MIKHLTSSPCVERIRCFLFDDSLWIRCSFVARRTGYTVKRIQLPEGSCTNEVPSLSSSAMSCPRSLASVSCSDGSSGNSIV